MRAPRLSTLAVVGGALLLLLGAAAVWMLGGEGGGGEAPGDDLSLGPPPAEPASRLAPEDFAGTDACAACHREQVEAWAGSTHGTAGAAPPDGEAVIAPFDGRPIRFRDAEVRPVRTAEGGFAFVVAWGPLPPDTLTVDGVVGRGHMQGGGTQGFFTRQADGTVRFLPFDWSRTDGVWFCNTRRPVPGVWLPVTEEMALADCADWPPQRVLGSLERFTNCEQCHGSRIRASWAADRGRYETEWATLRVDCESCHGPAADHVERARAGTLGEGPDIGLPALATLDEDASLRVCFRCHATKLVLGDGDLPGEPLERSFSLLLPILTDRPFHPDGRVRNFAYQLNHLASDCYLSGAMTCVSCHDPHTQAYRTESGEPLEGRFDDGQCLGCHASKAARVEEHTFHPAGSAGSRCVSCHMPYLQHPSVGDAVPYARADHTIPVPRPASDAALGLTSACAACHADRTPAELQARAEAWWGELKPRKPLVQALLAPGERSRSEAARALLRPGDAFTMAQFIALSRFVIEHLPADGGALEPEVREPLEALARSPDPDLAALALAGLHLARGEDPAVRRFLVERLEALETEAEARVRERWTTALSYLGDVRTAREDPAGAAVVFRKALELDGTEARIQEKLGLALMATGDLAGAEEAFRTSIRSDPARPFPALNLAFALEQQGRLDESLRAYRETVERFPVEPQAHFRLGNALLRRRDVGAAGTAFARAVELDPGLAAARVGLAQVLAVQGDVAGAQRELVVALQFDPGNDQARQLLRQLGAPGAGGP